MAQSPDCQQHVPTVGRPRIDLRKQGHRRRLAEFEPEEIVALLSAFVFQEKTENVPTLPPRLEKGMEAIIRISDKVNDFQIQHQDF